MPVPVPCRCERGVDIKSSSCALKPVVGSGAADGMDSAEYALQLVRFPFRQVWGDREPRG